MRMCSQDEGDIAMTPGTQQEYGDWTLGLTGRAEAGLLCVRFSG